MARVIPPADLLRAEAFLTALGGSSEFTFLALPEGDPHDSSRRPQPIHGLLATVGATLAQLNAQGYGIFVMVNEGDLKGRKAANVTRVRALFVDLDGAPLELLLAAAEPPHIIVNTSPGRYHGYWRIVNCPLDEFKVRQQALAEKFGGDRSVCDLPRVMRLPGFYHLKSEVPFMVQQLDAKTAKELL